MDHNRLAVVPTSLIRVPSRRDVLRGLVGAGLGLAAARLPEFAAAKKKRKKKPKRPKPNAFGCLNVGQPCQGNGALCCSGICEGTAPRKGKKDASRCVAHNASICTPANDLCATGIQPVCNASKGRCTCTATTGKAGFCADFSPSIDAGKDASFYCRDCSRDTDCEAEFGPGAACIVYEGICSIYCPSTGGTACMPACI